MQEEADSDRQLAMYSIWVKDKFKEAKSVKLIEVFVVLEDVLKVVIFQRVTLESLKVILQKWVAMQI
jgi:hypothetical protein